MKKCVNCKAKCTGSGKEGIATQCSFYNPDAKEEIKRKAKILEIVCCGDCLYYDRKKHECTKGAVIEGDLFYEDCPLEEA